ncbi:MAG: PQQ-binding-like beta-propeller repeat protein [Anaeromyxobacteraceae bacterium]
MLVDLELGGQRRKVLVHPERNGYVYVLDRTTGEVLSATPYVHVTGSSGVDLSTGRLVERADRHPITGKVVRDICPAAPGGKDWQPSAWSPRTQLLYIPHQNLCMDWESVEVSYIAGTPYVGANVVYRPGPGGHMGEFTAWDPVKREARWKLTDRFPIWSGALATAGDLVFFGTMDGWFKAVDARDGAVLWQWKLGSGIIGQPVTWRGPDGRQYVSVLAGIGGWPGVVVLNKLDVRDRTAANGWGEAMKDLAKVTAAGGTLYTFGLP